MADVATTIYKLEVFQYVLLLVVVLMGCFVEWFLINCSLILGSTIDDKSIKNWPNKAIENKMQVGMDFGWILDRFLENFWPPQVGGSNWVKLAPTSVQKSRSTSKGDISKT